MSLLSHPGETTGRSEHSPYRGRQGRLVAGGHQEAAPAFRNVLHKAAYSSGHDQLPKAIHQMENAALVYSHVWQSDQVRRRKVVGHRLRLNVPRPVEHLSLQSEQVDLRPATLRVDPTRLVRNQEAGLRVSSSDGCKSPDKVIQPLARLD